MSTFPITLEASDGYEWSALAQYNSEKARGIVHTAEWDALMAEQQRLFEEQQIAEMVAAGGHPLDPEHPEGSWMVPGPKPSWWERVVWWLQDRGLVR